MAQLERDISPVTLSAVYSAKMSNVSVCVRFRPLNARESLQGSATACIRRLNDKSLTFKDEKEEELTFTFDKVFYEDSIQDDVFESVALPIVKDAMNAINGTVLTYGQTGAGKTHSMEGPSMQTDDPLRKGILPRVAECIFGSIAEADESVEFLIKLSMVEIYMEKIRDLLDTAKDNLQVKENKLQGIFVAGVTEKYVQSEKEMLQILQDGIANRAVAATQMNAGSSRSHCAFLLTIQQTSTEDRSVKTGKIYLVDLAGSEKVEKTGAEGRLLSEAKTINKSLSALGNVINALTSERACHIPYRDSKLTRILQESLGGNSRTTLLCCCSPSILHSPETLSTLRFGTRAKQIQNKPKVNAERGRHELEQLLQKSEQECEKLRGQLLMSNARLRALNQGLLIDADNAVHGDPPERISITDKLRVKLSDMFSLTPDAVIEHVKNIFVEEGLLQKHSDCGRSGSGVLGDQGCAENALPMKVYDLTDIASYNKADSDKFVLSVEDETCRTIMRLQHSLEELMDEFDQIEKENESLRLELLACVRLLGENSKYVEDSDQSSARGRLSFTKPSIICPIRGGSHPVSVRQPTSSRIIDADIAKLSPGRILLTKVMQFFAERISVRSLLWK